MDDEMAIGNVIANYRKSKIQSEAEVRSMMNIVVRPHEIPI